MKKIIITVACGLMATGLWAQNDGGAKIVPVSQAIQKNGFTIQVGLPFLGQYQGTRKTSPADMRFPWDVLYLYNTFAEESFDVSKGYFGDKILISWDVRANIDLIKSIKIYKRVYDVAGTAPYIFAGSVAGSATQYEDKYAEGGVLYQYKVVADGISTTESLYTTYITGFGFRNPTAIVTGNISYTGGNPVKDVVVMASTAGNSTNPGSALYIPATSSVQIVNKNTPITTSITYQAWARPKNAFTNDSGTPLSLFRLLSINNETIDVSVNLLAASKKISVNIGNSIFELKNYFPSGKLNSKGNDIMVPVTDFNTSFVHFSVVMNDAKVPLLFINGRPITAVYKEGVNKNLIGLDSNYTTPYFDVTIPTQTNILKIGGNNTLWTTINVGGGNDSSIDEIRIWNAGLQANTIRTDYSRYISGNDPRLISYLRANEKVGLYAYDLSRNGFNYNKNNGTFKNNGTPIVSWANGSGNFPSADQLGILGVTDVNGNYEITAIPYSGTGESFTITPMYGQHKFEPNQQLVFLGLGSEVVNRINFIDKSSFSFKGVVQYDSRGVFPSFVDVDAKKDGTNQGSTNSWIDGTGIVDNGNNNNYELPSGEKFSKGEYWKHYDAAPSNSVWLASKEYANGAKVSFGDNYYTVTTAGKSGTLAPTHSSGTVVNGTAVFTSRTDYYLDKYARIYTQGAYVYIDGIIVLDANSLPVVTSETGSFDVSVPIGNHYITVKKDGHVFSYNGRFPENTYKEFFEDSNEAVVFIDKTRVTVVGKVAGGSVEAAKKIGFGQNGLLTKKVTNNSIETTLEVSAKNNIGTTNFTLGYAPDGANVTNYTKSRFSTNTASGEYRVDLLPLQYGLLANDLTIPSSSFISLIKAGTTEPLDFSKAVASTTPEFVYTDGGVENTIKGEPYHFEKSFIYRSTPTLQVTEQTSDGTIKVNGIDVPTTDFVNPVYTQFKPYKIVMDRFESYTNNDPIFLTPAGLATVLKVPVTDGELIKQNNLALLNTEEVIADGNKITYTFKAGVPSITPPFELTSTLKYRINDTEYPVIDFKVSGIILGGSSDGSQTFVTAAPDVPAIILRDPPGSSSFATIEKGESFSFTSEASLGHKEGGSVDLTIGGGVSFELTGGLVPMPKVEINTTNSLTVGLSLENTSTDGKSTNTTYTFNKAISTSDASDYVGADGDLYIGNSKNIFYGSYDNIEASATIPKEYSNGVSSDLAVGTYSNIGTTAAPIYISKQKALSFVDKPTATFFVFSQKHILTTLIPEYELFISSNLNGLNPSSAENVQLRAQYAEKIRLWRKVILDNEKSKYLAKNKREKYKQSLVNVIANFNGQINSVYNGISDPIAKSKLTNQLRSSITIKNLLDSNFSKNISFDAGVGDYSQSAETTVVSASNTSYNLIIDESIALKVGFDINKTGFELETKGFFQQDINSSLSEESTTTTNISYTLKDNDTANFLSVDVVDAFDGNGPIFSTLGGRSSCPYEGAETSKFYPESIFKNYFDTLFAKQDALSAKNVEINTNESAHTTLLQTRNQNNNFNIDPIATNRTAKAVLIAQKVVIENEIRDFTTAFENGFNTPYPADTKNAPLNFATQKVEVPVLRVTDADKSNITESKNAEFELILENNSAAGVDADFNLVVDNTSNPNNALINIEPNGTVVHVPYGETVIYKMTLGKSISDVYEYKDIKVRLESLCDGEDVSSSVLVSAHFVPSCSQVIVSAPLSNWVSNIDNSFNTTTTTDANGNKTQVITSKPLLINLKGYNTGFKSFKKIDLEYRLSTSPNWSRLQTYYGTTAFYNAAVGNSETQISNIGSNSTLAYSFDIGGLKLGDGNYEIRARSTCTNDTEYISDVVTGRVDLHSPQRFGTPLPIDGILGVGEDLKVSFNEPIFYNSAVSTIQIKGQTNQLPIDNNVSMHFEGLTNTAVINNPRITTGDLTVEFWMNNSTTANTAVILSQEEGLTIRLENGNVFFNIGGLTANGSIATDNLFHHYTFNHKNSSGELRIYQDDKEIGASTGNTNVQFSNNNALTIGGNSFIGNMHALRLWNKAISLSDAYAKMYTKLLGNEANLIGYWPMDEGKGNIANDKARYKHAVVKAAWDIKPKGSSYEFSNGQNLILDQVGNVQLTTEMDATVSFWMKTAVSQEATLFSNGKGDGTDIIQTIGSANKWAVNMNTTGNLSLESEGKSYSLTSQNMADNVWHHVTLLFNRLGSLKTYVDGASVSSNLMTAIRGFSGNKIWLGARGATDLAGNVTVDRAYRGKLDEFQFWNTLRNEEQINRDRFNEVDVESIGLLLYARMNAPDPATTNGPRYYHVTGNNKVSSDNAMLSAGTVTYATDVPPIKPELSLIKFLVNNVINQDAMIMEPIITDWASLEGQVVDITVDKMFDSANNMQQSPITWTAYVKRNEVSWFAEGYNEIVDIVKKAGEDKSFDITLLNKGGKGQPFTITNIPKWLQLRKSTGTLAPNSKIIITATIDKELTAGEYLENLYLQTDFGYDEKLQIKVRVLAPEPDWAVNPTLYKYSMNIVGRIKVDAAFSEDSYDKIAAFSNGVVRGSVNLVYNNSYQEYFAFLTVYSNSEVSENIEFKIWDASQGKVLVANINAKSSIPFEENGVLGRLSLPAIFENSNIVEQNIAFNNGWTWVSMNVVDDNFSDLNQLTKSMNLVIDDRILSHSPARLETYYKDGSTPSKSSWSGGITADGGLTNTKMYKVFTTYQQALTIKGTSVNASNWSFPIKINWNWLPYSLSGNQLTNEALAYFDAVDGDVIKSQNLFAIYDPIIGWNGTLNYLESGKGYMIKSTKEQTLKYPSYLSQFGKVSTGKINNSLTELGQETIRPEFMKYADNMNAVVSLPKGYNELYAYDANGVLKGATVNQYVNNEELSFITVYGEIPETLVFYIGDGISKKRTSKSFSFKGNDVLGTITKPIIIGEIINDVTIYPNPFNNEITIKVNAVKDQIVSIQLYSLTGQIVLDKKQNVVSGENVLKIQPRVASGAYLLQIEINGEKIVNKVMKN